MFLIFIKAGSIDEAGFKRANRDACFVDKCCLEFCTTVTVLLGFQLPVQWTWGKLSRVKASAGISLKTSWNRVFSDCYSNARLIWIIGWLVPYSEMIKPGPLVTFANKYHGMVAFGRDLWRPSSSNPAQTGVGWSPLRLLMSLRREIPCAIAHSKKKLHLRLSGITNGSQWSVMGLNIFENKKCLRPLVCCLNSRKHVAVSFALNLLGFLLM